MNEVWSLDVVLQDQQGNRVQATIKGKHINKFQLLLDEGACYRIGNFGVGENSGKWPLLNHNRTIENGWTYLACKKYRRSAKEADSDESLSSVKRAKNQQFWNCRIHKGLTASLVHMRFKVIVRVIDETWSASLLLFDDLVFKLTNGEQCHTLIQKHGPNYDDYFPPELNVLVGKRVLWRFQYTYDHI
nr:replication protein A 70 kDa DNA-binding subunit B [Tanacetum cinerariifolium]